MGAAAVANPRAKEPRGCEVTELFAVLGQPHTLRILHAFQESGGSPLRFTDLQRALKLSPKTLAQRLRTLVEAGFLSRHAYNEIPPRVEYGPTSKTGELSELFDSLDRWSKRNSLTAVREVATVGKARA
ncbi:MAG TPA: helix-turn-helix domain-containing protein [Thermoplasmata archaeon]